MPRLFGPKTAFYLIVFIIRIGRAVEPVCNAAIYGVTNYKDCSKAFDTIPFALNRPSDTRITATELWSEPQYLSTPFGAVQNRYRPRPINQIPKIWRYGEYNSTSALKPLAFTANVWFCRHVPCCTHELWQTQWQCHECIVQHQLGVYFNKHSRHPHMCESPTKDRTLWGMDATRS